MKIALFGYGKMGQLVAEIAKAKGHHIVAIQALKNSSGSIESSDVCIDFSHSSVVLDHLRECLKLKKPLIVGTTGWEHQISEAKKHVEISNGCALYSPNFSLGIALFIQMISHAAPLINAFSDYEMTGIEYHHREKKDAPSGTAKKIAEAAGGRLSFTSVRCGEIPGTHTVLFDSKVDTITLTHQARSREGFAYGAIKAAEWIVGKTGWWTFDEMVRSLYSSRNPL